MKYERWLREQEGELNRLKTNLLLQIEVLAKVKADARERYHVLAADTEQLFIGSRPEEPNSTVTAADVARRAIDPVYFGKEEIRKAWTLARLDMIKEEQDDKAAKVVEFHNHCKEFQQQIEGIDDDLRKLQALINQRPGDYSEVGSGLSHTTIQVNTTDLVNTTDQSNTADQVNNDG